MAAHIPGLKVTDQELLITSVKVMCTQLRDGAPPDALIQATMRNIGGSWVQAQDLFDAGTTIYCPEFAHR